MAFDLIIRPARLDEREALIALQRRASLVAEEYRAALLASPDAIDVPAAQIRDGLVLVAESGGDIIASAAWLPPGNGAVELDGLFVSPDHMRQGIGRTLVQEAVAAAMHGGAREMRVIASPLAVHFYRTCGFAEIGPAQTRFGPAMAMTRLLD